MAIWPGLNGPMDSFARNADTLVTVKENEIGLLPASGARIAHRSIGLLLVSGARIALGLGYSLRQEPFKNPPEVGSCRRNPSKIRQKWVRVAETLQKSARSGFVPQRPFKSPPEVGSCRRHLSKIRQKWVRAAESLQKFV